MRLLTCVLSVAAMGLTASVAPGQSRPGIADAELVLRLSTTLDSLSRLDEFSGVVVLARAGSTIFDRAYGMADRTASRPNTTETAFNIGSLNKLFTATAARQLVAAGKLDLKARIDRYWPDYPNRDVARRVTIGHLIDHTSGVTGNIFAAPAGGSRSSIRHNRDYLALFVSESLAFDPGSREAYSNAGYVLLGMIISRVSGEDYYDYVRKNITDPVSMSRTMHLPSDSLPVNAAIGYTKRTPGATPDLASRANTELLPGRGSSAGGGYSTASDLIRFVNALREGRIPGGPPAGIGAAGGAPGLNAVIEGDLPGGYDLVVIANLDPPAAMRVARMVRQWIGAVD